MNRALESGDPVMTTGGAGTVIYVRMAPSDFDQGRVEYSVDPEEVSPEPVAAEVDQRVGRFANLDVADEES